jgi:hypothetical protein
MSDQHDLLDLPILDELGADLGRAFRAAEGRRDAPAASSRTHDAAEGSGFAARAAAGGRRRRGARWGVVAVAAAAVAGAFVAVDPWGGNSGLGPAQATAAGVLRRAAAVAQGDPATVLPRADQYAYADVLSLNSVVSVTGAGAAAHDETVFVLSRRQTWSSIAHRSVALERPLQETRPGAPPPALTLRPRDLEGLRRATAPDRAQTVPGRRDADGVVRVPLGRATYRLGQEELTAAELRGYPTEAAAILRRLRVATAGQGRSPNGELWVAINDALRDVPLPAPLAAGLYRALAAVPGVTLDGPTTDRLGRRAVRLSYQEPGTWERETLLLDARTFRRLGNQTVVASTAGPTPRGVATTRTTLDATTTVPRGDDPRPPYPAGTVTGESLVLRSGVTDRVGGPLVNR